MKRNGSFQSAIMAGRVERQMGFDQKVWALCARVPAGRVSTYAQIAQALNSRAYRAVGAALGRNPYAPKVPCHRIVGSDGRLVGYAGGLAAKARLLKREGVKVDSQRVQLARYFVPLAQ
ncbi:MAG: MGMT family protein [Phycisphaeraceae bacterium]|nr:MGMT family protein [Phycisphaeraceae bacterium]